MGDNRSHTYRRIAAALVLFVGLLIAGQAAAATWTSQVVGSITYWYDDGKARLYYNSTPKQWFHYSTYGGWNPLSATGRSSTFIGDGTNFYDLGNGYTYLYTPVSDMGVFKRGGTTGRFAYYYDTGRWAHRGEIGGWLDIGKTGLSASFLGDGGPHDILNGFSYSYDKVADLGYFKKGTQNRFAYFYGQRRWVDAGNTGGWQRIGNVGLSASFLGDAGPHDLTNGFTFTYDPTADLGYFKKGASDRFAYFFGQSRWVDAGNTGGWQRIGNNGLSASFLGDAAPHDLLNGFTYFYNIAGDLGVFRKSGTTARFAYYYMPGRWVDMGNTGGWQRVGNNGLSASFLGDSAPHDLLNGFTFTYDATADLGIFKKGTRDRFAYFFTQSRWVDRGNMGSWQPIGSSGLSSSFLGDTTAHVLNNGFTYAYNLAADLGIFKEGSQDRFAYFYGQVRWVHKGNSGAWQRLGSTGLSASFLGDSAWHELGDGWSYAYGAKLYPAGWGLWKDGKDEFYTAGPTFAYIYASSQWLQRDLYSNGYFSPYADPYWSALGGTGIGAAFVGDGSPHGFSAFSLVYGHVQAGSYTAGVSEYLVAGSYRFAFVYGSGQWYDHSAFSKGGAFAPNDGWSQIGNQGGLLSAYIGDGTYHDLGLSYWFKYTANVAYYAVDNGGGNFTNKFSYDYSAGQWQYAGSNGFGLVGGSPGYNLGSSGQASLLANVGTADVDLKWAFASGINPASFNFDPSNTSFTYIMTDNNDDGKPDRIEYTDPNGHKVAEAEITAGSKGIRIAVDKTFVGTNTPWDGGYFQWWDAADPSSSLAYHSPLVLVYDGYNMSHLLFEQYEVEYFASLGTVSTRDGQAWIWEDTNGNGKYDVNNSDSGDRILHWRRQKDGTCGIYTAMNITESVTGNGSNTHRTFAASYPDDTIQWFSDKYSGQANGTGGYYFDPPYDRNTMDLHDSKYHEWGGTTVAMRNAYLTQVQGFRNPVDAFYTFTDLVNQVNSGKVVFVSLSSSLIWAQGWTATDSQGHAVDADHDGYLDAGYVTGYPNFSLTGQTGKFGKGVPGEVDHAVWLRGFQRDTNGNITHVIVEDSGGRDGAFARISVNHFKEAFLLNDQNGDKGTGYGEAGVLDPPSGWSWSTAGINTWTFNPAIWSATW